MAIRSVSRSTAVVTSADERNVGRSAEDVTLEKMKANLIHYSRKDDRKMILRILQESKHLKCLSLDPVRNLDGQLFDLEKECAAGKMTLNGVMIKGAKISNQAEAMSLITNSSIPTLKGLCRELCDKEGVKTSSRELYEKLVVRLAKSTSSADPYFRLNSLLGSSDLLVMPLEEESGVIDDKIAPADMNVYASNGEIHMTLTQTYKFGLLRKSDVKTNSPWFIIYAVVSERANLTKNSAVRQLKLTDIM